MLVRGIAKQPLDVIQALGYRGVMRRMSRPDVGELRGVLVVRGAERLEVPGVMVRGIRQDLLDMFEAVLDGGMGVGGAGHGLGVLVMRCLQRQHGLVVFVRGIAQQLLEVVEALRHRSMRQPQARNFVGVLVVHELERLQILGVLVRVVADHPFEVLHALAQRRMMPVRCAEALQVLCIGVLRRVVLRMGRAERLDLAPVLVRGGAEHLLEIIEALG
mmetsp:Transcript_12550/g.35971  ORF Transcript_12550/g.35971 Transcript_12550/m.35971 type:complete len:217 (-) Transcript_12550:259-909(-)